MEDQPPTTLQVSTTGNDDNDGVTSPVLTLKRAIEITAANPNITMIKLEAGRYQTSSGETYPYRIQSHITVAGPVDSTAVLIGNTTVPGLIVDDGIIQDLELENFTIAIIANSAAQLTNIKIRASDAAIRAEAATMLLVDNVDVTGTPGACSTGIELHGNAMLTATDVSTRGLGTSLHASDSSIVKLSHANMTGDTSCSVAVLQVSSSKSFTLNDSTLNGGRDGIAFLGAQSPTQVALTDVTIQNMKSDALTGDSADIRMTRGSLSNNTQDGARVTGGNLTFTNVAIVGNTAQGIDLNNAILTMRGCFISGNGTGVKISSPSRVDLGTDVDNGNNTIQNRVLGLFIMEQQMLVSAVGNTWQFNVQGADNLGRYTTAVVSGPIPIVQGNNYSISDQSTLLR